MLVPYIAKKRSAYTYFSVRGLQKDYRVSRFVIEVMKKGRQAWEVTQRITVMTIWKCSTTRGNPGRYLVLEGVLEIWKSFEMAIAREVKEESGIDNNQTSMR